MIRSSSRSPAFAATLGMLDDNNCSLPLLRSDATSEDPNVGVVETWAYSNLTEDAQPIHVHPLQIQIVD